MKIEIVHGDHTPVTKFFSSPSNTPETDEKTLTTIHRWIERHHTDGFIDSLSYLQNLERVADRWYDRLETVERERDKAIHGAHVNYNFTQDARRERDEARAALMKIEDIFCNGENTHDDWFAMGNIAKAALEGAK